MNRSEFYAALCKRKSGIFGTRLTQGQVAGMTAILDEAERRKLPLWWVACPLGQTYHETGGKMQPVYENMNYTSAKQIKNTWPTRFKTEASARPYVRSPQKLANFVYGGRNGNDNMNDGWLRRGRGLIQITFKDNDDKFGIGDNPEAALEMSTAVRILFDGMINGIFTGKKLSDYNLQSEAGRIAARAIINGDVKKNGAMIAGYAEAFANALRVAGYGQWVAEKPALTPISEISTEKTTADPVPVNLPEPVQPLPQEPIETETKPMTTFTKRWWQSKSIWGAILTLVSFSGLFGISFDADTMTLHIQLDTLASQVLAGGIPGGAVLSWFGRLAAKTAIG
jgi:putative chitinase